jgi:hypothetical protein
VPVLRRPHKEKPLILHCRRQLKKADVERIFFLRFGSHSDMSRVQLSYKKISLLLHIPIMTCHKALRNYIRRGLHFESGRALNSCPDWRKKLLPFKEELLARDTLQRWSGLTLQHRAQLIWQEYHVKVTVQALFQFYRKHKVRFYSSSTAYHAAFHKKFVDQRKQFAVQLAQLIHQKAAIVYFDESSFNSWMR